MKTINQMQARITQLTKLMNNETNKLNREMLYEEIQELIDDIQIEYAKLGVDRLDMNWV